MTPLADTLAAIDADNQRRRWRVYAGALALGLALIGGAAIDKANNTPPRPAVCADKLGISWSMQDGATSRLEAFKACVGE